MEPREEQRTAEFLNEVPASRQDATPKRFRIDRLEERIAPKGCACAEGSPGGSCYPIFKNGDHGKLIGC